MGLICLNNTTAKVYTYKRLKFILMPQQTVITHNFGSPCSQTFYLMPLNYRHNGRVNLIRKLIGLGEIRSLNELAGWTRSDIIWQDMGVTRYNTDSCDIINLEENYGAK